jgi:hypothetical protein
MLSIKPSSAGLFDPRDSYAVLGAGLQHLALAVHILSGNIVVSAELLP